MHARVHVLFPSLSELELRALLALGQELTNDPNSVRVCTRDGAPGWLTVEFTLRTELKSWAVTRIDDVLDRLAGTRRDSIIEFPKSDAERERDRRKATRRRERNRANRESKP